MYFYYFHLRFKFWWVNLFKGFFFPVGKKIVFTKWETLGTDCIASSHFSGRKNCINSRPKHGPLQRQWKRSEEWSLFLSVKNLLVFWINYKKYGGWNRPIYRRSSGPPKLTHYTHQKAQKKLKAIFSFFKYKRSIFIFEGSIKITYISKIIWNVFSSCISEEYL